MKIALAAMMLMGAPAMATVTIYQQPFDNDRYFLINQYNGPLQVVGVSIDWTVWAFATGFTEENEQTLHSSVSGYGWFDNGTNDVGLPHLTSETVTTICYYEEWCGPNMSVAGHIDLSSRDFSFFVGAGQLSFVGASMYIGDLPQELASFKPIWSGVDGNITYFLSDIPEPTSWALMLAGFGAIGTAMRRHRAKIRYA